VRNYAELIYLCTVEYIHVSYRRIPIGCKGKHSYYLSSAVEAAVAAAATGAELCGMDLFLYGILYFCIVYAEAERVQRQALVLFEFGGGGGGGGGSDRCGTDPFVNMYVYTYTYIYRYTDINTDMDTDIDICIYIYLYIYVCNFVSYLSSNVPYTSFYLFVHLAIYIYIWCLSMHISHTPKPKGCKGKHSDYLSLAVEAAAAAAATGAGSIYL